MIKKTDTKGMKKERYKVRSIKKDRKVKLLGEKFNRLDDYLS